MFPTTMTFKSHQISFFFFFYVFLSQSIVAIIELKRKLRRKKKNAESRQVANYFSCLFFLMKNFSGFLKVFECFSAPLWKAGN